MDISTLKNKLKRDIRKNDFEILSNFLDDCQRTSYSQLNHERDNKKTISMLINTLKKIDKYV